MVARKITLLMIFVFIFSLVPVDVVDAEPNSQGLEWGFQEGDHFNYTLRIPNPENGEYIVEKVIVSVVYLEALTYPVGGHVDLRRGILISWKNGTPTSETMRVPPDVWDALPIGNWSVFSEWYSESSLYQIHDTPSIWGYTLFHGGDGRSTTETFEYSKTDGAVQRHFMRVMQDGQVEYQMELTRDGYVSNMTIIVGTVGAGIILLVIGILVRRRRVLRV